MLAAHRLPGMKTRFAVYYFLRAYNEVTFLLTQVRAFSLIPVMFRAQLEIIVLVYEIIQKKLNQEQRNF